MPLNSNIKVEMPAHCVKAPKNGTNYIQYTVRAYRNAKGKPTSARIVIGKLDEESGMLIPNRNYYEYFHKEMPPKLPEIVRSAGTYTAFRGVAKKLGLEKTVREVFGEDKARNMLTVAHYMLCEGNVMYYLPDFMDETLSYAKEALSGADISRLFSSVTPTERSVFFNNWMRKKHSDEYIAYDVTSISSYGVGTDSLEWGYNRDKERLRQINFGMYFGEETKLPLYYRLYPGSIPDKAHLPYMLDDTDTFLHKKKLYFVMDRGFYSADNLRYVTDKGYRFLIALPGSLKYVNNLIDRHRGEIVNRIECSLGNGKPYGKAFEVTELGFRMNVHIYYDPMKAIKDSEELQTELLKLENELRDMAEPPDRTLHYDRYFFINRSKDGKLGYRRNDEAVNKALSRCGFFMLAETDFRKTTAEILDIYRRRDTVEKSFDNLKNDLDMHRLHTHSDETAEGKTFCAFLSLIVLSDMMNCLGGYMSESKLTFRKILLELGKVKCNVTKSGLCSLLNPLPKTVKDIFALLDIPTDFSGSIV